MGLLIRDSRQQFPVNLLRIFFEQRLQVRQDAVYRAQEAAGVTINEDGTLARLEEKYLGHGDDFDYVDTRSFLRAVDSVLPDLQPLFEKYSVRSVSPRLCAVFLVSIIRPRTPVGEVAWVSQWDS